MRRAAALTLLTAGLAVAAPTPAGSVIHNQATFDTQDGAVLSNAVEVTVQAVCAVRLSPAQQRLPGQVGASLPFTFTVLNAGNAPFRFDLRASAAAPDQVTLTPTQLQLAAGEGRDVQLTLLPGVAGVRSAALQATCEGGGASADAQATADVEDPARPLTITKAVNAERADPGAELTYTLTVHNPGGRSVSGVEVRDPLPAGVTFLSATGGLQNEQGTLRVTLPELGAGQSAQFQVRVRLSDQDEQQVDNTATLRSAVQDSTPSNTVRTVVYQPKLAILKTNDALRASVGSRVNFTVRLTNSSVNAAVHGTLIVDRLPAGLRVDPASLKLGGQTVQDRNPDPQVIEVEVGDLKAGAEAVLTYATTVTPDALNQPSLRNVAYGITSTVRTPDTDSLVVVEQPGLGTLIGRIFLDRDGNGLFDAATDTPVRGARLLISGVGTALTDASGQYGVSHLRSGDYAVTLDQASLTGFAQREAGGYGLSGAKKVALSGLGRADFALRPPQATSSATRTTRLSGGGLTVSKTVSAQGEVTLTFRSTRDLSVNWRDPLPAGLQLAQGQNAGTLRLSPGVPVTVLYRLSGPLTPETRVTDPEITPGVAP